MKRLHVSLGVEDLEASVRFYETLFGAAPTVRRPGYAKWMLDDPRVNFVLDERCAARGVDHLGIQVEGAQELAEVTARLKRAGAEVLELEKTQCCYAVSDKSWASDPQGVDWETFRTHDLAEDYGDPRPVAALGRAGEGGGDGAAKDNGGNDGRKRCC